MGELTEKVIVGTFLFIVAVALYALFVGIGSHWNTGDGVSTDYVMGVEHSGLIWRTYDVYLRNEHPTSTNVGRYCLPPSLVNGVGEPRLSVLQGAAQNNSICKLFYHSQLAVWPWECGSSNAIIDRVEC